MWGSGLANYLRNRPDLVVTRAIRGLLRASEAFQQEFRTAGSEQANEELIPLDSLLCGGEHGISAAQYARHTGDLLRPSRPLAESPHVKFLQQYVNIGNDIFKPAVFQETSYFANAAECLGTVGQYFTCTRVDEVEHIARRFVRQFSGKDLIRDRVEDPATLHHGSLFSATGSPVLLRPIVFSKCYEIVDGNHRLAIAYMRGEKFCRARLIQPPAVTPLQQLLFDHIWVQGRRELYQPIDSPELREEWDIVRRCDDRFDLMQGFLHDQRLMPPDAATYLDVACSYGWFVNAFHRSGFIARGVELDWSACEIAKYCFGLNSEQITRSEVVRYLTHDSQTYDLVSCFSLLHHFVMKRGSISAEALLALLDAKAMKVLFLDMGQEHEEWFHETLAGWNPDRIEQWIIANSTFKKVFRLGTDHDNVPPYEKNYGRTLFACMR